ncbi:ABC transporter permease, partial [Streptomyces sp. HSW2009]
MRAADRTTWTLALRLLRGGGRTGALGTGLAVAAAALCTTLLLLCLAVNAGFQDRAARTDWRGPVRAAEPIAVQAVGTTFHSGRSIIVVDLAPVDGAARPRPARPPPPRRPRAPPPAGARPRRTPGGPAGGPGGAGPPRGGGGGA